MADPRNRDGLGELKRWLSDIGQRLRELERTTGAKSSATKPVNTTSVQADQFLGGIFSGVSGTFSGFVRAAMGVFSGGVTSSGVRQNILSNQPVQLYVDAAGNFGISASTRAKKNIGTDYAVDMTKFLNITLKNWSYKDNPSSVGMGPIADDLDAAGLREFVIYSPVDGSIQGVRTDMLIIGLWSAYVQSRASTLKRIGNQSHQVKTVTNMTALALGGTKSYPITWDAAFVDADYMVTASVYSSAGIPLTGVSASCLPSARTATGCTVQVTSGVTLLSGQTLVIEAIHI